MAPRAGALATRRRRRSEPLGDLDLRPEVTTQDRRHPLDLRRELRARRRAGLLEPSDPEDFSVDLPRSLHAATGDDDRRDPTGRLAHGGAALRWNDVCVLGARTKDVLVETRQQAHGAGRPRRSDLVDIFGEHVSSLALDLYLSDA